MKTLAATLMAGLLALASTNAVAQERQFSGEGHAACLTEELLDQMISAAVDRDNRAMNHLLANGCIVPRAGIPVTVLDRTWTGKAHVRAYVGDNALELWTVRDALTD